MIRTKSIYKTKDPQDGFRVLITRFYPRGVKKTHFDIWMRDLAPSQQLLKEYKTNKKTWKQFTTSYKSEIQQNKESIKVIKSLKTKIKSNNITLLCYEKDGEPCHRHLLKEIIQKPQYLRANFAPDLVDN